MIKLILTLTSLFFYMTTQAESRASVRADLLRDVNNLKQKIEVLRKEFPTFQKSIPEALTVTGTGQLLRDAALVTADGSLSSIADLHFQLFDKLKRLNAQSLPITCADEKNLKYEHPPCHNPTTTDSRGCCTQAKDFDPNKDKNLFLSCYYYACAAGKYADLKCDAPGKPNYLVNYGLRNCAYFTLGTYEFLTVQGKKWLTKTLACLQNFLSSRPLHAEPPQPTCEAISSQAFDSHVPCYVNSGLCDLPLSDQLIIGTTPDSDALLTDDALKQVKGAVDLCVTKWNAQNPNAGKIIRPLLKLALGNERGKKIVQDTGGNVTTIYSTAEKLRAKETELKDKIKKRLLSAFK